MNKILGEYDSVSFGQLREYGLHYEFTMHCWCSMEVWERSSSAEGVFWGRGALLYGVALLISSGGWGRFGMYIRE